MKQEETRNTKNVGECLHLINGFICSCGKYQNYPCPFRTAYQKCHSAILITEEMKEQWDSTGMIVIRM